MQMVNMLANPVVVGASQSGAEIARFNINHEQSLNLSFVVVVSAATVADAVSVKLQHSYNGGAAWVDVPGIVGSVTAPGAIAFGVNVQDPNLQDDLPLYPSARVVAVTGTGDAVTVSQVWINGVR